MSQLILQNMQCKCFQSCSLDYLIVSQKFYDLLFKTAFITNDYFVCSPAGIET